MLMTGDLSRSNLLEEYEKLYDSGYAGSPRSHKLIFNLVPQMREHGVRSVLDVGCGRGAILSELRKHRFEVTGTEPCPKLLAHDLARLRAYPFMVHEMDMLADANYDFVLSVNLLDHLPNEGDVRLAIKEHFRIARLGVAFVVCGDPPLTTIKKTPVEWISLVQKHHENALHTRADSRGGQLIAAWFFK
jgi:2-polyprenyl-3-methyl-5-hydroxy-6-metoxy-1,4-benzoquinol methylase